LLKPCGSERVRVLAFNKPYMYFWCFQCSESIPIPSLILSNSLQVSLGQEKSGEDLQIDFPLTIATVPFRIPNTPGLELEYGK
jgi:hypothetical protein